MKQILPAALLACCLAILSPAARPQSAAAGAHNCRQVQDPGERLRCYDAQDAATASATPSSPAAAARPEVATAPAAPTAPAAAAVVAPPSAKFGEENLPSRLRPPEPKRADRVLTAGIKDVREVRPKVFNITLVNGQIWRQEGTQATMFFRAGADAHIEKGALGDYRMSTSTTGDHLWVRVTRIQ